MNREKWVERENELRLDLLESLVRSQRALASLIERAAEAGAGAPEGAAAMLEHVETLSRYQLALSEKIAGHRLRRVVFGRPGSVWVNRGVCRGRRDMQPKDAARR